ncbi:MAG: hypothetical protein ABDH19_01810 [Thermodesulfovibrio sp.]
MIGFQAEEGVFLANDAMKALNEIVSTTKKAMNMNQKNRCYCRITICTE